MCDSQILNTTWNANDKVPENRRTWKRCPFVMLVGLLWFYGDRRDVKVEDVVRLVSPDVGTISRRLWTLIHHTSGYFKVNIFC